MIVYLQSKYYNNILLLEVILVKLAKFTHHILTEEDITPNEPVINSVGTSSCCMRAYEAHPN